MKKCFIILLQSLCLFSIFSFDPLYYSIESKKVSDKRISESDLYVIDTLELDDGEDIEDYVKVCNKTSTEIQKITIYATGDYLLIDKEFDFWSWSGTKSKVVGQKEIDGLMFLGTILNVAPGKTKSWNSKLDDGALKAFRYIVIEVNKPEEFQFKIINAKQETDDLIITIGE